ncbi:MAG TPA: hypothetical protein VE033_10690 [Acetobacteraceae bacterium]|jgi:hypothetical protein|nr:hypothetical protein [Acetobacteraceae bacterium]
MSHDNHDDGLVHSHNWAKEPPPAIGELLRPVVETGVAGLRRDRIEDSIAGGSATHR